MFQSSVVPDSHVPNHGPTIFAVSIATLVLATTFVAARLVSRFFIVRRVRWDDRVMILAWLIAFFLSFTIALGTAHGLGKHDVDIPQEDRGTLRRCEYVFSILYNPALMATKSSVLIFFLRLFKDTQFVLKYWSWALLAVVNLAGAILTLMNIFQCRPIYAAWDPYHSGDFKCIPLLTEFICSSPINIITNLCLLCLPIPVLTGMRLPKRQKVAVVLLFSLGIFVTVVDVVRIYFLQTALTEASNGTSRTSGSTFGGQTNFAWNASRSFMWSAIEVNIGITCACIPTLKPLILKLLPSVLHNPHATRNSASKNRETETPSHHSQPASPSVAVPPMAALPYPTTDDDDTMTGIEFLTVPDMLRENAQPPLSERPRPSVTQRTSATENAVYFGFVNMAKPKSMLKTSASESFKYCSTVAILFLLWGISYGLLNTLNNVIASINKFSTAQTLGLTSAYFGGGYFFGPLLVGEWILRRDEHNRSLRHKKNEMENVGGFKVTFIVGLSIYGIGTIIFWPSAVTGSYGGFMVSNFIVGFGLSVLEVAANAFIILCGPPEFGETRLLLAQAVQATGSVLSGLLANKVFFSDIAHKDSVSGSSTTLVNVQWTYLAITLFCAALALFFYYMPLPEVGDQELENSAKCLPVDPQKKILGPLQLRTICLVLAVAAQYFYVAAQESNSIYFNVLLMSFLRNGSNSSKHTVQSSSRPGGSPPGIAISIPDYLLIGRSAFAISRFLAGWLTYLSISHRRVPRPRTLLTISIALSFLFALLSVVLRPSNPNLLLIPIILFFFAEGPVWPLIFAIGLRGQGRRTKRAAAFITMGGSGGGVVPFIIYGIVSTGGSAQTSYIIIVVLQVFVMAYPIFLEAVRDARSMVDPIAVPLSAIGTDEDILADELVSGRRTRPDEKTPGGWSRFANGGFLGKIATKLGAQPESQHNENYSSPDRGNASNQDTESAANQGQASEETTRQVTT